MAYPEKPQRACSCARSLLPRLCAALPGLDSPTASCDHRSRVLAVALRPQRRRQCENEQDGQACQHPLPHHWTPNWSLTDQLLFPIKRIPAKGRAKSPPLQNPPSFVRPSKDGPPKTFLALLPQFPSQPFEELFPVGATERFEVYDNWRAFAVPYHLKAVWRLKSISINIRAT